MKGECYLFLLTFAPTNAIFSVNWACSAFMNLQWVVLKRGVENAFEYDCALSDSMQETHEISYSLKNRKGEKWKGFQAYFKSCYCWRFFFRKNRVIVSPVLNEFCSMKRAKWGKSIFIWRFWACKICL